MTSTNNSILDCLTQSDKDLIKDFLETFYTANEVPATFIEKVVLEKDTYVHYKKHVWGTLRRTPVFKDQFLQYMYTLYPFLQRRKLSRCGKVIVGLTHK